MGEMKNRKGKKTKEIYNTKFFKLMKSYLAAMLCRTSVS